MQYMIVLKTRAATLGLDLVSSWNLTNKKCSYCIRARYFFFVNFKKINYGSERFHIQDQQKRSHLRSYEHVLRFHREAHVFYSVDRNIL